MHAYAASKIGAVFMHLAMLEIFGITVKKGKIQELRAPEISKWISPSLCH
jgi:hypothetical protein